MIQYLYAQAAENTAQAPASPLMSFVPLLFIFVIFYFLLIRPQQKKMKQHKTMLENIKVGDKVITSSGFYVTIVSIGDTTIEVKLSDTVKATRQKSSMTEVLSAPQTPTVVK
jgi:preprotein translocase subunit YajC